MHQVMVPLVMPMLRVLQVIHRVMVPRAPRLLWYQMFPIYSLITNTVPI